MSEDFQKTVIPIGGTGSICFYIEIPHSFSPNGKKETHYNDFLSFAMENDIKTCFCIQEDSNQFLSSLKKKFGDSKIRIADIPTSFLKLNFQSASKLEMQEYIFFVEQEFRFTRLKNFFLISSNSSIESKYFLCTALLSQDESIAPDDLVQEIFKNISGDPSFIEKNLLKIKEFIYSEEYLTYKHLKSFKKEKSSPEFTEKHKSSLIEKASQYRTNTMPIELNLSSLDSKITESPLSKIDSMTFNLSSLDEKEFHPEEGSEDGNLLDDLMNFAESLEINKKASDEWSDAFPDTGAKVENNLLATTTEMPALEIETEETKETNALEDLIISETDEEFAMEDLIKDDENFVKLPKDSPNDKTIYIEAIPEEQAQKKDKNQKKPPTIIVTAEKMDTIRPITEEMNSIANKNFNAIHLD